MRSVRRIDFTDFVRYTILNKYYVVRINTARPLGPQLIKPISVLGGAVDFWRCGQCWNRTSSLLGVNETLYH